MNCTLSSARPEYLNGLLLLFFSWKSCGIKSCGCVILVNESYVISSVASDALHIFVMLWCRKAVSNGVRAASLPNDDFSVAWEKSYILTRRAGAHPFSREFSGGSYMSNRERDMRKTEDIPISLTLRSCHFLLHSFLHFV